MYRRIKSIYLSKQEEREKFFTRGYWEVHLYNLFFGYQLDFIVSKLLLALSAVGFVLGTPVLRN